MKFWEDRCQGKEGKRPEHCSKEFWAMICRATQKEPKERYQNAEELWEALFELALHRKEVTPGERTALKMAKAAGMMGGIVYGIVKASAKRKEKTKRKLE